ncbi:MAG TPA: tetratricopeptide repeat protein [Cytophagaceae bacterium]
MFNSAMKLLRLFSCLLFILLNSQFAFAAKQIDWYGELLKIELEAYGGNYKSALKKNKALLIKIEKQLTLDHHIYTKATLQQARIYEGLGELDAYNSILEKGISLSIKNSKENIDYCKTLLDLSDTHFQFGDIKQARIAALKCKDILSNLKPSDEYLIAKTNQKLSEIYYKQGYLKRSRNLIKEYITFYRNRIVKKENVTDPATGKTAYKSLPKKEIESRKRDYAITLNHWAQVAFDNGDLPQSDSILKVAQAFISKEFSKKDISFIENLYLQAQLLEAKNDFSNAFEKYYEALKISSSSSYVKYKASSKLGMKLNERAIITSRLSGKNKQGKKLRDIFTSKMKGAYGKGNVHYSNQLWIESERNHINGDLDKADEKFKEIINNPKIPASHPYRVQALQSLYKIYIEEDRYDKAEEALTGVIKIQRELHGEETPTYHTALLEHAAFLVKYSNKFLSAESIYEKSLESVVGIEVEHSAPVYVANIYQAASFYELTDRYDKSLKILNKSLEELKKKFGTSHVFYGVSLDKLAAVDIDLGKYDDAEKKINSALELYKSLGSTYYDYNLDYSHALETQARLYIIQGKYMEAEATLKKAYKLTRRSDKDNTLKISSAIEELATLYIFTGKYQETEKTLLESVRLKEKKFGVQNRSLITPLNQLGQLYLITGDFAEAEKNTLRAASISQVVFGGSSAKYAESLKLLQNIYTSIGDYDKASDVGDKALQIQISQYGKNHIYVANTLSELALLKFYSNKKDPTIEEMFSQSLAMIKANLGDRNPSYAQVSTNMAYYYLETGKIPEAEKLLDKANSVWIEKLGKDNIHSADILYLKGNIAYIKGKYADARDRYNDAKNLYEKLFDNNHPHYVKSLSKSAQMNYILGDYKTAIKSFDQTTASYLLYKKKYFPSLSEREKNKFWNLIKSDFEFYNTMALKLGQSNPDLVGNMYNFTLNTKAILLNSSIKVKERILHSNDAELIKKYEEWISKKENLTTLISMSSEQRKANGIDVKSLEKEIETLEKQLSSSSELFISEDDKDLEITWQKVKESLKENEVAVEIVRFRYFDKWFTDSVIYAALVLSPQTKGNPELILLNNGNELESKYLKYFRNSIKFSSDDDVSYDAFWKPLKKLIKDKAVVYLSAEGVYNQINLEAIKTPAGKYIIDDNELILVSNTRDLIARTNKPKKSKSDSKSLDKVALVGNPSYYNQTSTLIKTVTTTGESKDFKYSVKPLPGAEKEVKSLFSLMQSSQWPTEMFLNEKATETEVKKLQNPKVFHIATHGFFLEDTEVELENIEGLNDSRAIQNPLLRSGLLLTNGGKLMEGGNLYSYNTEDGILTAYEAMNLNFDKTDLVVLSACETGLGEVKIGEGVYGLQRAFLVAGAKNVVMSLFKVSDEVTQELMLSFFKKWINTGDKRKSFLEAKKEIKTKHPEPIYWASFIMVGID